MDVNQPKSAKSLEHWKKAVALLLIGAAVGLHPGEGRRPLENSRSGIVRLMKCDVVTGLYLKDCPRR
jgi:hypothetical protein